jgi:GxxExxY protein
MTNLLYKSEVYEIIGACMEVHRTLGFGFLEVIYKDAMDVEFMERQISFFERRGAFCLLQRKDSEA